MFHIQSSTFDEPFLVDDLLNVKTVRVFGRGHIHWSELVLELLDGRGQEQTVAAGKECCLRKSDHDNRKARRGPVSVRRRHVRPQTLGKVAEVIRRIQQELNVLQNIGSLNHCLHLYLSSSSSLFIISTTDLRVFFGNPHIQHCPPEVKGRGPNFKVAQLFTFLKRIQPEGGTHPVLYFSQHHH